MSITSITAERTGRLLSIYLIVTLLTCQGTLKLHNTMLHKEEGDPAGRYKDKPGH